MRDYSKVSGQFWTGKTGKSLRGDFQAQVVAMYLMTSPHANMIGVFHCPIIYIAHETGSPIEGAMKGLQTLCEGAFCTYDEESETVWVHEMARFQTGGDLKATDKRVQGIQKLYDAMPEGRIKSGFFEKYGGLFHIKNSKPLASPLQAPTKPEAGTGTGTEESHTPPAAVPAAGSKKGTRLTAEWELPEEWGRWAEQERRLKPAQVLSIADRFKDFWISKAGKDACKLDWQATWRNWVRNERATQ